MNIKVITHKRDRTYYSVEFPSDVSLTAVAGILGISKQAVQKYKTRVPKEMISELREIPETMVKR